MRAVVDFNPNGRGGLDTRSWTASLYGSTFLFGDFYVDGVLNYGSDRHINYEESGTVVDRHAKGSTDGDTLSIAAAAGYDFSWNGFTFSPNIGYLYIDTRVDEFSETVPDGSSFSVVGGDRAAGESDTGAVYVC